MRLDGAWASITILNISSRGLMARTGRVPSPRSYVEISRGSHVIIGKVVWQDDRHFGIRTQDPVSLDMMIDARAASLADSSADAVADHGAHRPGNGVDPVEAFERNRQRAALGQFAVIVAGGATLVAAIGIVLHRLLGESIWVVIAHLS